MKGLGTDTLQLVIVENAVQKIDISDGKSIIKFELTVLIAWLDLKMNSPPTFQSCCYSSPCETKKDIKSKIIKLRSILQSCLYMQLTDSASSSA